MEPGDASTAHDHIHVAIYDHKNPTLFLGLATVADCVEREEEQERVVRPVLLDEELVIYHQLWRALLRGLPPTRQSECREESITIRPALPVELVRLIIRTADLMVPDRQQTQCAHRNLFLRVQTREEEPVVSRVWFWTKSLDVLNIAAVQLITVSRDQGWVFPKTDVCHSWFEWAVLNGGIPTQEDPDIGAPVNFTGNEMAWKPDRPARKEINGSADNQVLWHRTHGNPVADQRYQQHNGPKVGKDDEMWDGAQPGSVIAVRACAQQAMWENDARYGEILVWKWFEPVVSVA
ncbi:hypothetical protein C8R47DRAFT_1216732 [Mycena vitilis]|nr:hypothetical protein C8R47DRAFT_1216732 [Mycena vitilis]